MPDFRRRLQRALSLSSSESEYSRSPSRSLSSDTTQAESSTHSNNNDQAVPQHVDHQQSDAPRYHDHGVLPAPQYDKNGSQLGDSNMITLTCLAELDVRMESLDRKLTDQSKGIEDVCRDLVDHFRRLKLIETGVGERPKK